MRIAVCPGSYDPVTLGHLDIVRRASALFDSLYVAVLDNPRKQPLFSVEERVEMLQQATADLPNVVCESFRGLVVDYAARLGARVIVRGVRNYADYEYELPMAAMNRQLRPCIETLFMPTAPEFAQVSSSLVKEVAFFGGDIARWVPQGVEARLLARLREKEGVGR